MKETVRYPSSRTLAEAKEKGFILLPTYVREGLECHSYDAGSFKKSFCDVLLRISTVVRVLYTHRQRKNEEGLIINEVHLTTGDVVYLDASTTANLVKVL